jgi:molybdate transport system substrate-binding protein
VKERRKALVNKLAIYILMILLLAGCSHTTNKDIVLTIGAAASMKDVLEAIGDQYEKEHENIKLTFTFSSTGTLQKQIEQGAPIDIFVSADPAAFERLVQKKLVIAKQNRLLAYNELVLITSKQKANEVHSLSDLKQPAIRSVAIGIPETVPAGAYAKQWLQNADVWKELQEKYVLAKDVRQVLTYVESGNADCGIVYRTDALSSKRVRIAATAPHSLNQQIAYKTGVVAQSKRQKEAEQFITYLYSKKAARIFVKYGFIVAIK